MSEITYIKIQHPLYIIGSYFLYFLIYNVSYQIHALFINAKPRDRKRGQNQNFDVLPYFAAFDKRHLPLHDAR